MYVLGISAFYHDSAATLIRDGVVIAAAEEERFSRKKHDNGFPHRAIAYCLSDAGINIDAVDCIAYYEKPLLKFERVLETFVETYPRGVTSFIRDMPELLGGKLAVEHLIRKETGFKKDVSFIPHHLSHAAAAFFTSPYKEAAVLTIDGIGEYQTTGLWFGTGNTLQPLKQIDFPHSIGLLYATYTSFLGFRVNDDEYKVMGLAALGSPRYTDKVRKTVRIQTDGSFALDMRYFSFRENERMWSRAFEALFGTPRQTSEPFTEYHADLAASIQAVTEELYFGMLRHLHDITHTDKLCVSGGVALNALANGKISVQTPFTQVSIFGPAGDSGGSTGAALFAAHHLLGAKEHGAVRNLKWGPAYNAEQIEHVLKQHDVHYEQFQTEEELCSRAAQLLAEDKVIGWFQGRMEFGPRALGSRSILASPGSAHMKDSVNAIKGREEFRPFGGSVLEERMSEYVEVSEGTYPFMNFCFPVKKEKRDDLSAIVHRDGTCRIQTVSPEDGVYHRLLTAFSDVTGIPFLLNTSFNIAGEPIVENPDQAVRDFLNTPLDGLVIGNFLAVKASGTGRASVCDFASISSLACTSAAIRLFSSAPAKTGGAVGSST